jgi:hypothetical protein
MRDRMLGGGLVALALVALIGCSSSGGSSAPGSSAPSAAPSVAAASEAAASLAAPSEAAPSAVAASGALPSFLLPSDDKELEALIPDKICGVKVTKLSVKGDKALGADPGQMLAVLNGLGKTTADVGMAMGLAGTSKCAVFILRIAGVDESRLRDLMKQYAQANAMTWEEKSLGGKTVARTDPNKFQYAYVKGDGVISVGADSEAHAAEIISQLP